jgi:hypothetical protein
MERSQCEGGEKTHALFSAGPFLLSGFLVRKERRLLFFGKKDIYSSKAVLKIVQTDESFPNC